jgi:hypothetical protein
MPCSINSPARRAAQELTRLIHRGPARSAGGAADDLEHVAGCGQFVHRARKFGRALAQFVKEPRILDGNNCLVGKRLKRDVRPACRSRPLFMARPRMSALALACAGTSRRLTRPL